MVINHVDHMYPWCDKNGTLSLWSSSPKHVITVEYFGLTLIFMMTGCWFLFDAFLYWHRSDFSHSICYCNKAILGLCIPRSIPHSSLLCSSVYRSWLRQAAIELANSWLPFWFSLPETPAKDSNPGRQRSQRFFSFLWLLPWWLR